MLGLIRRVFARRPPQSGSTIPMSDAEKIAADASTSLHVNGLDASDEVQPTDELDEMPEFSVYDKYADTKRFLVWYIQTYETLIGIQRSLLWARYQEYCCVNRVRPLTQRQLECGLRPLGCISRRPGRKGNRRITVYDLPAQVSRKNGVRLVA